LIESVREQDGTCRHRRLEIEPASLGLKLASLGDLGWRGRGPERGNLGLRLLDGERGREERSGVLETLPRALLSRPCQTILPTASR